MSILRRPGWMHTDTHNIITEARGFGIGTDLYHLFAQRMKEINGVGIAGMGAPFTEFRKFIGMIILENPEFAEYFPITKLYQYKQHMYDNLLADPETRNVAFALADKAREIFSDPQQFKELNAAVHGYRRAKSTDAVTRYREGDKAVETQTPSTYLDIENDPREKGRKWAKLLNPQTNPFVGIDKQPPTEDELMHADAAMFKYAMAALLLDVPIETEYGDESVTAGDIMEEYPSLIDVVMNSDDPHDFLENLLELVDSEDPSLSDIAGQIYQYIKPKFIRGGGMPSSPNAGQKLENPTIQPGELSRRGDVDSRKLANNETSAAADVGKIPAIKDVRDAFEAWKAKREAQGTEIGDVASNKLEDPNALKSFVKNARNTEAEKRKKEILGSNEEEPEPKVSKAETPKEDEEEEEKSKKSTDGEYSYYDNDEDLDKDKEDEDEDDFDEDEDDEDRPYRESVKVSSAKQMQLALEERRRIDRHRFMIESRYRY